MKSFGILALAATVCLSCASSPFGVRPLIQGVGDGDEGRGRITITFEIIDEDLTWPSVAIEYFKQNAWREATLTDATVGAAVAAFDANVMRVKEWVGDWTPCTVTWDSLADDVALDGLQTVTIRLTPRDLDGAGEPVGHQLTVNNRFPTLGVTTASLAFEHAHGGANPASQTVWIENSGPDATTLVWSVDAGGLPPWLSVGPTNGTLDYGDPASAVAFSVDPAGQNLDVDTYDADVTFTGVDPVGADAHGSPFTVHVTLAVRAPAAELFVRDSIGAALADLCFQADAGSGVLPGQSFWIDNRGEAGSVLSWTATDDLTSPDWLSYSPGTGAVSEGASAQVAVVVDATGLGTGTHTAVITVTGLDQGTADEVTNSPWTVTVYLTVGEAPVLSVTPASLTFTATEGGANPASQTLVITNPGGGTLDWSVTEGETWLTLSPTSGECTWEMDEVTVSVNVSGLAADSYNATITVTAPGAAGSPKDVAVTLTVTGTGPGPARVTSITPAPGSTLGTAPTTIVVTFNKAIDASTVNELSFELVRSGGDGTFDDGNEVRIAPASVALTSPTEATMDLAGASLPDDTYRVTLYAPATERWGGVMNVAELNTSAGDRIGSMSPDGLVAYLHSDRPGGSGGADIWRVTRTDATLPWGTPTPVSELNTSTDDFDPYVSADGLTMWFGSSRTGGAGLQDIWTASRPTVFSLWGTPTNASGLNGSYNENRPSISPNGLTMWFGSDQFPATGGGWDVWVATRPDTVSSWQGKTSVSELKVSREEESPWVSPNGLTMYYSSDRSGGLGQIDIWKVTRPDTSSQWGAALNPAGLNSTARDIRVWLNSDESTIWFSSDRSGGPGGYDIWKAQRIEPVRDLSGYRLDGEFGGAFPSGNGVEGGDFVATFALGAGGPTSGLVAHWKFDETGGTTAYDSSGSGNNGALLNGPVWRPAGGKRGGALEFDGTDDFVESLNPVGISGAEPRTLAFWAKPVEASYDGVAGWGNPTGDELFDMYIFMGAWALEPGIGAIVSAEAGVWEHHAATYDGTTIRWYASGVEVSSQALACVTADTALHVGFASSVFLYFDGLIDDVRVYDRALSAAEMVVLADSGETGLVAHWRFNKASGTTSYDSSGNGNHGTRVNGPDFVSGRIGGALRFSGENDHVVVPDSPSLNPTGAITIAAWINADSWTGRNARIVQKSEHDTQYMLVGQEYDSPQGLRFALSGVSGGDIYVALPSTGVWHHVAGTYDGSAIYIYVDGTQAAVGAASGSIATTSELLHIGTKYSTMPSYSSFDGKVDDARIYNRALSATEVQALFDLAP